VNLARNGLSQIGIDSHAATRSDLAKADARSPASRPRRFRSDIVYQIDDLGKNYLKG
jgi:hypothetical protein